MDSQTFGRWAESRAKAFLQSKGLQCIQENYRSRFGEIDLIMQQAGMLIFVEVRARKNTRFGYGMDTVTWHKQQKIIKTAALYIQSIRMHNKAKMRFDVVSVDGENHELTWVQNAFYQDL